MTTALTLYWVNQYTVAPDQAGGTRHYDMAHHLGGRGDRVVLVASDLSLGTRRYSRRRGPRDLCTYRESRDGVGFAWLPAGSYRINDWRRITSMLVFAAAAFRFLLREDLGDRTVFIGSSPHLFAALGTWAAARLRRVPFVLEVRDLWPESYEAVAGRPGGGTVRLLRVLADFLYRRSDAVVVLAEPNRGAIASRGVDPARIDCIPNGVDLSAFPARGIGPGDPGRDIVFAYTGAHGPANGLEVVVNAWAELEIRGVTGIKVLLVGDGPAKDDLCRLVERAGAAGVELRDPVPKAEVPALLASVDAGLMILAPAALFGTAVSPNKLFDYLAADLPVLTNVPGIVTDTVLAAGAGQACPPGDASALATAMADMADRLRADPGAYRGGRRYVVEHHDRASLARRLHDLAAALLDDARPAP